MMYLPETPSHTTSKILPFPPADVLRRESDHRIANNLALIVGLVRLRARSVVQKSGPMEREEVRLLLDDIATRVDTVARLHRMLSRPSRHDSVNVCEYLQEICESLAASLTTADRVMLSFQPNGSCVLPPDQVLTLGLLVSELIANSIKHAHPTGVPVRIDLSCHQAGNALIVEFADDGVGLPENFDPMVDGGLGLRLVRSISVQLGASLNIDSDALGTRVRVEMPAGQLPVAAE
jgi:two-component sensor histidine kinase